MNYTVVIIDDEPWSLIDIQKTFPFEQFGFDVLDSFQDPILALTTILKEKPDLIITDVRMPNLSGIDLIERIRGQNIDSEVVVVSGYNEFEYAKHAIDFDAIAYCLKPSSSKEAVDVLLKVKQKLDKKRSAAEQSKIYAEEIRAPEDLTNFDRMIAYIDHNFCKKLVLSELSKQFYLNCNYCCTLFIKHKKMTFSQYVSALRIEEAKKKILTTGYGLEKIAEMVGFSDYFYFSKVFKKICGCSPKEYQKQRELKA